MNCLVWLFQLGAAGPAGVMSAAVADMAVNNIAHTRRSFFIGCPLMTNYQMGKQI
jgi:hypothetical protein